MTPHWVCLDEMNLAPVEQYYADYLSVLETRDWDGENYKCDPLLDFNGASEQDLEAIRVALKIEASMWDRFKGMGGIPLPPNLIVVGTVNMDETTHAFSRKVLDRAFTVEFDAFSAEHYRNEAGLDPVLGIEIAKDDSIQARMVLSTATSGAGVTGIVNEKVVALVDAWNRSMDETPFRVAYRTLNEALLYVSAKAQGKTGEEEDAAIAKALDDILMMKLLPRLEGDAEKLGYDGDTSLRNVPEFDKAGEARNTLIHAAWLVAEDAVGAVLWQEAKSRRKLIYMAKRLSRTGYTSFWP